MSLLIELLGYYAWLLDGHLFWPWVIGFSAFYSIGFTTYIHYRFALRKRAFVLASLAFWILGSAQIFLILILGPFGIAALLWVIVGILHSHLAHTSYSPFGGSVHAGK